VIGTESIDNHQIHLGSLQFVGLEEHGSFGFEVGIEPNRVFGRRLNWLLEFLNDSDQIVIGGLNLIENCHLQKK
jgi:hypothetical protein